MEGSSERAMKVSRLTIAWNAALSAVKLLAGVFAHSGAMISDAVHSLSDVFSTVIVMFGIRAAQKASDKEHPYGHERMECVAAIVLSGVLLATGLMIGWQGVKNILSAQEGALQAPGILALLAAVLSIAVKEGMYRYTRKAAKELDSSALMADAIEKATFCHSKRSEESYKKTAEFKEIPRQARDDRAFLSGATP